MTREDLLLLGAYSNWSEETSAAAFVVPDAAAVRAFRTWLNRQERRRIEKHEQRFFDEYYKQER
jgi:hypothetical protein